MTESNERYSRQELFAPIGEEGQARLGEATVLLVGCGGLGSIIADMLVRAGVGCLRMVDRDFVELSNLQRQVLFDTADAEALLPKAEAARRKLERINPQVAIDAHVEDLNPGNIRTLAEGVDLVIDGTDNFEVRFLVNDYCVATSTPWVYGGAVGSSGMSTVFVPGITPCLRCLFDAAPPPGSSPTCETAGVISPLLHVVAGIQVAGALRQLVGEAPTGQMVHVDVWTNRYRAVTLAKPTDGRCEACDRRIFPYLEAERGSVATSLCGRDAVQLAWKESHELDLEALGKTLSGCGEVKLTPFLLRFECAEASMTLFPDGRAVIKGTGDPARARELYARYVGQ